MLSARGQSQYIQDWNLFAEDLLLRIWEHPETFMFHVAAEQKPFSQQGALVKGKIAFIVFSASSHQQPYREGYSWQLSRQAKDWDRVFPKDMLEEWEKWKNTTMLNSVISLCLVHQWSQLQLQIVMGKAWLTHK